MPRSEPSPPTKAELRARLRALRDAIPSADREAGSAAIRRTLLELPETRAARRWHVYVSYRSEVATHDLIRELLARGDEVFVPDVLPDETMAALPLAAWTDLEPGRFGILTPRSRPPSANPSVATVPPGKFQLDVCLLPGLGFTAQGDRLGYGRGNYDRFLAAHPQPLTIAMVFDEQLVAELPTEPTDHRVDLIVTPTQVIRCRDA